MASTKFPRSALTVWYALRLMRLRGRRRPHDSAVARSGDPRADRVLVVGNRLTHGWDADSHQLGVTGQLSRAVSERTGRGCDVDVVGAESMNMRSSLDWIGGRR